MTLREIIKQGQKLAADNSPAILTAVGVVGTLTTAYLTGKASFKAVDVLREEKLKKSLHQTDQDGHNPELTKGEKVKLLWTLYVPAASSLTLTCAAIICANRVGSKRAAAMVAAYSLSERAFSEYKEKIVETIGKQKEEKVRAEVQQDRINANPPTQQSILVASGGAVLCKDAWSGRYFMSDMETIKKAQNDTNYEVLNNGYASLSDFYNRLELENTKESDDVGWNSDKLLDVQFTSGISDDQKPVLVMDFAVAPVRNFFRTH